MTNPLGGKNRKNIKNQVQAVCALRFIFGAKK
jgi:hypothetical protein